MRSIYRSEHAKNTVWELYDKQLNELDVPYLDLFVDTSFGKTHVIKCGNPNGTPLLVFHGGNATSWLPRKTACSPLIASFEKPQKSGRTARGIC